MNNHKNIVGKYNDGKQIKECFGKIEILSLDDKHKTAYASWQISDKQKVAIAGVTKSYYFGEVINPQEEIIKIILIDIEKYAINRRKVFSELEIK